MKRLVANLKKIPRKLILSVVAPFAISLAALQITAVTEVQNIIDQNIFHPFIFRTRELIQPMALDSRIKIITLGDESAAGLNAFDLKLPEWGILLRAIGKTQCHSILIDKLFDLKYDESEIKQFKDLTDSNATKIGILAFTFDKKIKARDEVSNSLVERNQIQTIAPDADKVLISKWNSPGYIYGATEDILSRFTAFGHNNYPNDNHSTAILNLNESRLLPSLALAMADSFNVRDGKTLVDKVDIHADGKGRILINFAPPAAYKQKGRNFGLYPVLLNAKRGHNLDIIKPGDYVVILPAMYTGNTDFKQTPFGSMPGGFTLVSMVNSILTGNWLREVQDPGCLALLFGIVGFLSGWSLKTRRSILTLLLIVTVTISSSILLFALGGIAWSFILPVAAVTLGCLTGIIVHSSVASIEESRIASDLEVATLVHSSFFAPPNASPSSTTRVQGGFIPATECGGDWWGTFQKHGFTYVMIGDAVGHGVPAALVTAVAFSVTRTIETELDASDTRGVLPSQILRSINLVLATINTDRACMTFQVFRIQDDTGECVLANAGNPQPILIPRDKTDSRLGAKQRFKTITARGNTLGLQRTSEFTDHTMKLASGDQIILYTDGLIENRSKSTGKPIGKNWLKGELERHADTPNQSLYDKLWAAYKSEAGTDAPEDDVTIVIISAS